MLIIIFPQRVIGCLICDVEEVVENIKINQTHKQYLILILSHFSKLLIICGWMYSVDLKILTSG